MIGVSLEEGLEVLELLLPFADFATEGFDLSFIEGEVEGNQNGALDAEELFMSSVGPDSGEKMGIEAMHGFSANGQQFRMLGWDQGTDEVERSLLDRLEVILRVV